MTRRRMLELLALAGALIAGRRFLRGPKMGSTFTGPTFYVAGARFGDLPDRVAPGERLRVRREPWRSEVRVTLSTRDGLLLGTVPREFLPAVERAWPVEARLAAVDLEAVPWKRYRVELRGGSF